ncbi:MAG: hypothetical protein E7I62_05955 [Bilophila wadsworthia]|uniref:hypothetical protein n=1 Tax=Bilophila wadsworthia TaxID=35833 RepID=UPI002908C16B|nr:hypothetical protein [Bilophila wadsworthia]MDU4375131.1 hypothetical protein [Bilophila wadsworthia]
MSIPRTLQEVAQKHGIFLTKDDPLRLLEAYCMEVLKNDLREQQAVLFEEFSQKLDIEYYKWDAAMEQRNKRMVDRILEESRRQLLEQLQSGIRIFFATAEETFAPMLDEIKSRDRKNMQLACTNLLAAGFVFLAALLLAFRWI